MTKRYRPDRRFGEGGFAEVWLVDDLKLNRQVAKKQLKERYADNTLRRFKRELTILASIDDPCVPKVFDREFRPKPIEAGTGGSAAPVPPYFVMEYIEGATLANDIAAFHQGSAFDRRMTRDNPIFTRGLRLIIAIADTVQRSSTTTALRMATSSRKM